MLVAVRQVIAAKLTLESGQFPPQASIFGQIRASGEVGIESEFKQQSWKAEITGQARVDLGPVKKPGWYRVYVFAPDGESTRMVLVLPAKQPGRLDVLVTEPKRTRPPRGKDPDPSTVRKLIAGLTKERLRQAASNALPLWLAKNAVSTSTTFVICVIPGNQIACFVAIGGQLFDLGIAIVKEAVQLMEKDRLLDPKEAASLLLVLDAGSLLVSEALPQHNLDRILTLVSTAVEANVEKDGVQLGVRLATDEGKKINLMLSIARKL